MKYARIFDGKVVEFLETDGNMEEMFHPSMIWAEVGDSSEIAEGWSASDASGQWEFSPHIDLAKTPEEIIEMNRSIQAGMLKSAALSMTPSLVSMSLGDATDEEISIASAWQDHYRAIKTMDLSPESPEWPQPPESM